MRSGATLKFRNRPAADRGGLGGRAVRGCYRRPVAGRSLVPLWHYALPADPADLSLGPVAGWSIPRHHVARSLLRLGSGHRPSAVPASGRRHPGIHPGRGLCDWKLDRGQRPVGRTLGPMAIQSPAGDWQGALWFAPAGQLFGLAGSTLRRWDGTRGAWLSAGPLDRNWQWLVAVSERLAVAWVPGGSDGELLVFDLGQQREMARFPATDLASSDFRGAIAPDGRSFAVAVHATRESASGTWNGVRCWRRCRRPHPASALAILFRP